MIINEVMKEPCVTDIRMVTVANGGGPSTEIDNHDCR